MLEELAVINKLIAILKEEKKEPASDASHPTREEEPMPKKSAEQNKVLAALRDVSGANFQHSDILFDGTKLVIPERWSTRKAISTIQAHQESQEQFIEYHRSYNYRPYDGAAATERALRVVTGTTGIAVKIPGFFGDTPPSRVTVATGVNEAISVPWGRIAVPLFDNNNQPGEAYIELQGSRDKEYGLIFHISGWAPKKYEPEVNGLFDLIQQELETYSIYKGKAINGAEQPEFLDLSGVDPAKVIYSDDVMAQMDAHLWGVIEHHDAMREYGIKLKRSVLFHGPYGTGKTLGGLLTAKKAVEHGFTFIMCRPGKDDPFETMQTAQLYAPSVVFIEDIDTYSRTDGMALDKMSELLDKFDGIEAKGMEILNVMTTNHEESITKGMLRPGRLDALIEIAHLDRGGVERMVQSKVDDADLDDVDYDLVFEACEGYLPAFVSESVERAMLASIVRGNGTLLPLNTSDIRNGAMSLRPQFDLMERASEVDTPPLFETVLRNTIRQAIEGMETENSEIGQSVIQNA